MTKEQFEGHFLQMSREMMTPWEIFKKGLEKHPGFRADQEQRYFDCFYWGLNVAHTLLAAEIIAFHDSQAATPKPKAVTPKPNRRAKWDMLGIPGPQQTLFDVLFRTLQRGDSITDGDWQWLFGHSDHQAATIDEFKRQVLEQVKG